MEKLEYTIQDWLETFEGRDPQTPVTFLLADAPRNYHITVYEDQTRGEPKPLIFALTECSCPTH